MTLRAPNLLWRPFEQVVELLQPEKTPSLSAALWRGEPDATTRLVLRKQSRDRERPDLGNLPRNTDL